MKLLQRLLGGGRRRLPEIRISPETIARLERRDTLRRDAVQGPSWPWPAVARHLGR